MQNYVQYTVIKDSREKRGWDFPPSDCCIGTHIETLSAGDYSLVGFKDIFTIERKGSINEWARNILEDRFYRELEKLSLIKYSFIILEFNMDDIIKYPYSSNLPLHIMKKIKIRGTYILRKTTEIQIKYRVPILFCGKYGKEVAMSLFKRIRYAEY